MTSHDSSATYLFSDGPRYWFSATCTVAKLAEDRAEQLTHDPDRCYNEIDTRLHADLDRHRGGFARIHPDHTHSRSGTSAASAAATEVLEKRGTAPCQFRNALVFLAAYEQHQAELDEAVRRYLAWQSIVDGVEIPNLRPDQARQARDQRGAMDATVASHIDLTAEDRTEMLPSGKQRRYDNRIGWAKTYLAKAGLVDTPRRGYARTIERDQQALASSHTVDLEYLHQCPELQTFRYSLSEEGDAPCGPPR